MTTADYKPFVRMRITELRSAKKVSGIERALILGKSGAYIRSICSGAALPSLHSLFNIIRYLETTPALFSPPCEDQTTHCARLCAASFRR